MGEGGRDGGRTHLVPRLRVFLCLGTNLALGVEVMEGSLALDSGRLLFNEISSRDFCRPEAINIKSQ